MRIDRMRLYACYLSSLLAIAACSKKVDTKPTPDSKAPAIASSAATRVVPPAGSSPAATLPEATASSGAPSGDSAWKPYAPNAGRYSVLLPGTPKETSTPFVDPVEGKVTLYQATLDAHEGGQEQLYIVGYDDLPMVGNAEKVLDGAVDGMAKSISGQIRSRASITLGKYPGRAATIEKTGTGIETVRVYLVGKRQYELITVADAASMTKFFDSFKLTQ